MASLLFKNNASTTLSGTITNTQTSITVASSSGFPAPSAGDYFYATMYEISGASEINIEIIKVTAVSGTTWTIVRGQDSTTGLTRSTTTYIELRYTSAAAALMLQKDNNLSDLGNASTARTNLSLGTMATQSASAVAITGGTISGVTIETLDSSTTIDDNGDPTKKAQFEVSGIATATTRTFSFPNASGVFALTSDLSAGYQPLDSDLTAFAALAANGIVARTGTGAVSVRSLAAPTTGFTITNPDGVAGNPTFVLANDLGALEALTTTGFARRTAADTWSASALIDGDLPSALTGKTYNALTLTANATGFSMAGGTTSKTLTVNNTLTLAGTDGTTITLPGTSGTVALNNQTVYVGTTAIAINRASASQSLTGISIDGSAASATTAATATKATNVVGGNSTTLLGAIHYQSDVDTTATLPPNTAATKKFLSQTGTGVNGAIPAWSTFTATDVGLGSVENTALSTWAGSANVTTLGTIATGTWNATTIGVTKGGTGQITAAAGFNALSPVTTLGDLIYGSAASTNSRLGGNTTTTRKFLRQTGDGTNSAAPAWDTVTDADLPLAITGKTYNALTLAAASIGFTVAGGTTSKTLTVNNTLALSGTDSSTLNIGTGGNLGTAAFTASTAYAPAAGSSSITTVGTISSGTWTGSTIGLSVGGTGATSAASARTALGLVIGTDIPSPTGTGASGSWGISVTGSAGSVAWTSVSGRPTVVSSFTNDSGYITSSSLTPYLPVAGGTMTGTLFFANATSPNTNAIQVGDGRGWKFRFLTNVSGTPTERFSFSDTGVFNSVGAITQNGQQVLHAANYTSYAPGLTGSGASGTWGINVTGSSASCTGNAANITGVYGGTITSAQVTTGLGFTPYSNSNPSGFITSAGTAANISGVYAGTITSAQVTAGLGFTPYNSTNPSGYITSAGTAANISGTYAGTITSSQITTGLGFTPYNSTNPSGYITSSGSISGTAATATTANALNTSNGYQITSLGVGTTGALSGVTGEIRATNNVTAYYSSDIRLKENVRDVVDALSIVSAIGSKTFDWTDEYIESHGGEDGYFVRKEDFGVVAQDVQAVFPQAVRERADGTLAVDYEKLSTLAFGAIQQLVKRIEALEAR